MKTKSIIVCAGFAMALGAWGNATCAHPLAQDMPQSGAATTHQKVADDSQLKGSKYLKEAKIQPDQARQLALKAFNGDITHERLEKKSGGSGLRYSFLIKNSQKEKHQVDIDANTGTVLENSKTHKLW